jgi:hypothetical protein
MAAVITEAAADDNDDQIIGASIAQLQQVDNVYENDEPDIVCYAHIVDTSDVLDFDDGDEPEFVTEANNNAEEHNERIRDRRVTLTMHPVIDDIKDFELLIYHTAQRVLHKGPQNVGINHYVPGRADLISLTYGRNIPESIIDYSDAVHYKFKQAGIHDVCTLISRMGNRTDINMMTEFKEMFNVVGMKGINRIPVIAPILGQRKGVLFSRGCICLKNRSYRPLLRDSTSPFKHTCLLIRVKEVPFGLYRHDGQC